MSSGQLRCKRLHRQFWIAISNILISRLWFVCKHISSFVYAQGHVLSKRRMIFLVFLLTKENHFLGKEKHETLWQEGQSIHDLEKCVFDDLMRRCLMKSFRWMTPLKNDSLGCKSFVIFMRIACEHFHVARHARDGTRKLFILRILSFVFCLKI